MTTTYDMAVEPFVSSSANKREYCGRSVIIPDIFMVINFMPRDFHNMQYGYLTTGTPQQRFSDPPGGLILHFLLLLQEARVALR